MFSAYYSYLKLKFVPFFFLYGVGSLAASPAPAWDDVRTFPMALGVGFRFGVAWIRNSAGSLFNKLSVDE